MKDRKKKSITKQSYWKVVDEISGKQLKVKSESYLHSL